jgi:hypothetical protein
MHAVADLLMVIALRLFLSDVSILTGPMLELYTSLIYLLDVGLYVWAKKENPLLP